MQKAQEYKQEQNTYRKICWLREVKTNDVFVVIKNKERLLAGKKSKSQWS